MPAAALAAELTRRGHHVALVSDARGVRFPGLFEDVQTHVLPTSRFAGGPAGWLRAGRSVLDSRAMALELYRTFRPAAVIGFGGYPAFPALLAAFKAKVPTAIPRAERRARPRQPAGRESRRCDRHLLRRRRAAQATADGARCGSSAIRCATRCWRCATAPIPNSTRTGLFRVLVTGGSQGASVLSQVVPDGLAMLPVHFRRRLQVTHQARIEDIDAARAKYAELSIPAELATYLPDMPEQLAWAHLVIARAGASTIAELTCAGRPAILVPLPSATDDHQTANAREITTAGGARTIRQDAFTPVELAKQMQKLGLDPQALANAAGRARSVGRPQATRDLADLVERLDTIRASVPVASPA